MSTYFYPATAECAVNAFAGYDFDSYPVFSYTMPNNTLGGYGNGLLDISDYNGATGHANLFITPDAALTSAGISDHIQSFFANPGTAWYWMRQTDFKDWTSVSGIFTRNTDFIMEVDISASMPLLGGARNEAANLSLAALNLVGSGKSPYGSAGPQGCGIMLKAVITDPITLLEVQKDVYFLDGADGWQENMNLLTIPRQTIQLHLASVTPAEMATMVLRVVAQQYSCSNLSSSPYPLTVHPVVSSTIYRIGLTPDPSALNSSGKKSAALTSR